MLELELADGRTISHRLEFGAPPPGDAGVEGPSGIRSDLARMGAARRLPAIGDKGCDRSGRALSACLGVDRLPRRPRTGEGGAGGRAAESGQGRKSWPPAGTASAPCVLRRCPAPPPQSSFAPPAAASRLSPVRRRLSRRRCRPPTWTCRVRPGPSAHRPAKIPFRRCGPLRPDVMSQKHSTARRRRCGHWPANSRNVFAMADLFFSPRATAIMSG